MDDETPLACLLRLWRTVLVVGVLDALHLSARREDVEWVGSPDFHDVCDLASADPDAVLDFYKARRAARCVFL